MLCLSASLGALGTLGGCASYMTAVTQMTRDALFSPAPPDSSRLNPQYRYMRVTVKGRVIFITLGYIDAHPHGPIDVFFSADREVVRVQNGYIVGATGVLTEWHNVSVSEAPAWNAPRDGQTVIWHRQRDVKPGYRVGIRDTLERRLIAPPERSALVDIDPASLVWFEDRHLPSPAYRWDGKIAPMEALPPARYAVDFAGGQQTVIYSEQCLSVDLCLTWQRWIPSTTKPSAAAAK